MRILKKLSCGIVAAALVVGLVAAPAVPAVARAVSSQYDSLAVTAGKWWSGKDSQVVALTSVSSKVYGGDAGVSFYATSVGLPTTFTRSSTRTVQIGLHEKDTFGANTVREYTGYFKVKNGLYRVTSYSNTYINSSCIEGDSTVELYMVFKVSTDANDTSKNVPKGLFKYEFWTD